MSLSPHWPYIAIISTLLACAYAGLVRWLNGHPRYGAFWRQQAWVEVAGGNCLIAGSAALIAGTEVGLLSMGLNAVWGVPMILATLTSQADEHVEEAEKRLVKDGR